MNISPKNFEKYLKNIYQYSASPFRSSPTAHQLHNRRSHVNNKPNKFNNIPIIYFEI